MKPHEQENPSTSKHDRAFVEHAALFLRRLPRENRALRPQKHLSIEREKGTAVKKSMRR